MRCWDVFEIVLKIEIACKVIKFKFQPACTTARVLRPTNDGNTTFISITELFEIYFQSTPYYGGKIYLCYYIDEGDEISEVLF